MMRRGLRAGTRSDAGHLRWVLPFALSVALVGGWQGCTPQKQYQVLSFFFEDVPDPSAPLKEASSPGGAPSIMTGVDIKLPPRPTYYGHKPYKEQKCNECHQTAGGMYTTSALGPNLCERCHKEVATRYPVMHRPVVAGACLRCHAPHESLHPALLREATAKLCLQCHDRELLSPRPPEHLQPGQNCLDCHVGHGGAKRMLLRDKSATRPAASQPAASQPAATRPSLVRSPTTQPAASQPGQARAAANPPAMGGRP